MADIPTWKMLSEGPMKGPSIAQARLFEKTETTHVPNVGHLFRTTVFKSDGSVVSVSLAAK